jgi:para-aminobenzoate synthetase component 1
MALSVQSQLNEWGKSKTPFVFLIDFECQAPQCWKLNEHNDTFKFNFQGVTNFEKRNFNSNNKQQQSFLKKFPISFEEYDQKFKAVKNAIEYGNSFLVNLTAATKIETNLSLEEIAYSCESKYICYLRNEFVCYSPESFVQIKDGKIFSYPMKGTIDARIPNAKAILLNDAKEIAEHATIVDLIRNDLSAVAKKVRVQNYRYYEEVVTQNGLIGQVSSEIVGELPLNYQDKMGDLLFALLPAGSVSGAPKQKTKDIIAKAEQVQRGYYTGVAGYFDGVCLDSCVLIRYLQADYMYRSGGGITALSDPAKEYQEMIDKVYVPAF